MPGPLACLPRAPQNSEAVIRSLRIETNERYKPEIFPGMGLRTKCNKVIEDYCEGMGVHIPKGLLARQQIQWLEGADGKFAGWFICSAPDADKYAAQGCPVLVGWVNPIESQSSHIAVLWKPKTIAQAGSSRFTSGTVGNGFGFRTVRYIAHL